MFVLLLLVLAFAFIDLMVCVGIGLSLAGDAGGMLGLIVSFIVAGAAGYYFEPEMSKFVR